MKNPPILISVIGFFAALAGLAWIFFGLRALGFDLVERDSIYTRRAIVGTTMPVCVPEHIATVDLVPQTVEAIAWLGFGFRL